MGQEEALGPDFLSLFLISSAGPLRRTPLSQTPSLGPPSASRRPLSPQGFHTTARKLQTCTFEGPGASNTTKIPREDPQREKKSENGCGRGGKKLEILGPPPFEPQLLTPYFFLGLGSTPLDPQPFGCPPFWRRPTFPGFGPSRSSFFHFSHLFFFVHF